MSNQIDPNRIGTIGVSYTFLQDQYLVSQLFSQCSPVGVAYYDKIVVVFRCISNHFDTVKDGYIPGYRPVFSRDKGVIKIKHFVTEKETQ
jgi:hypothetical protein